MDCIFCKIINGEIPSNKLYEDKNMIIINDINPQAKNHYLLIPKQHYANIKELNAKQSEVLGKCLMTLGKLVKQLGLIDGFRIVSNCGENGCQSVEHLHIHILGGQKLTENMA